jgi:hypothetical protein
MKFCKFSLFLALVMAVCLPAVAQTAMRVDIPFNFIAGGKSLPAGRYMVVRVFSGDQAKSWRIYNDKDAVAGFLSNAVESAQPHGHSLVFLQEGGAYSLIQIWNGGKFGREVMRSKVKQTLVAEGSKYVEIGAE